MKVGTLTFSYTTNAGSALQAYALKKLIEGLGLECSVINYQRENWIEDSADVFRKKFGTLLGGYAVKLYSWRRRKLLGRHQKFQEDHLDGGVPISRDDLPSLLSHYDVFITGSDQVWNQNNAKVDGSYFLDFVKDKRRKISYAPSFGVGQLSEEQIECAKAWLSSFEPLNLSVRERRGAELVSHLIGHEPVVALDPALLLPLNEWKEISKTPKRQGYIFIYQRVDSKSLCRFAKKLSRETGLPIVRYGGRPWRMVGKRVKNLRPDEWLGYVQNADYIVTNSFHGIVFSLNFKKPFFVEMRLGKHADTNSRLSNILNQLNLMDRVISDNTDLGKPIDYDQVLPGLDRERAQSIDWLKSRLTDSKIGASH